MRSRPWPTLIAAALVVIGLNALKPLHIDDATYYQYARQVAAHPFDPYGFEFPGAVPALHVLAPPALPYWWAAGLRLLGDEPLAWKLWLLPFGLLLVVSLYGILRRFARGVEMPLVWMTVLSPAFLPSWNLMLDLPALALGLFALSLFLRAGDTASWKRAAAAGLIAGVAMQTKYTAFVIAPLFLLHGVCFRRFRLGVVAAGLALLVFAGWEAAIAVRYGESHFLHGMHERDDIPWLRVARLALPLLTILGGSAPCLAMLGLAGLGYSRRAVAGAGVAVLAGFVVLAFLPERYDTLVSGGNAEKGQVLLSNVIFGVFGIAGCLLTAVAVRRLGRPPARAAGGPSTRAWGPAEWFLVGWLAFEVAGYFVLSPFPAVRRVLGIVAAATVVLGRLASQTCTSPWRSWLVWGTALASVALGLGFFGVDWREAAFEKRAVAKAARLLRGREPRAAFWSYGLWGFQFYADRAGMAPADEGMRAGDWLVLGDPRQTQWPGGWGRLEPVTEVRLDDWLPLRTVPCYYAGRMPLQQRCGPRYVFRIYRIRY